MDSSRRVLHIKYDIKAGGEVKRRMERYKPFFGVYVLLVGCLPVLFLLKYESPAYKMFAFWWFVWFLYSMLSKSDEDISTTAFFRKFPIYLPAYIVGYTHVFLLKRKYPNSDDEEAIKRFYRKKKLNKIFGQL